MENSLILVPIITDSLKDAKMDFERQFIIKKLEENEGNISKTAEAIGLERSNLHKKLKSLKVAGKRMMKSFD